MLGIVDYKAGNIQSVRHALDFLRIEYAISDTPKNLENTSCLMFPGVGNASYAMERVKKAGFDSFLKERAAQGIPLLGICLGAQILFDYSEENDTPCLGLLKGKVKLFKSIKDFPANLKIPHMGWNDICYTKNTAALFKGIPDRTDFYFVHSYLICPENEAIVSAYADYGINVPAAVHQNNIYACQFHPEKSGTQGLRILQNFAALHTHSVHSAQNAD